MRQIIVFLVFILLATGSFLYVSYENNQAEITPLNTYTDWDTLEKVSVSSPPEALLNGLSQLTLYDKKITLIEQSLQAEETLENVYVNITSLQYQATSGFSFDTFQDQTIRTDGYDLFIDTNGLSGELSFQAMIFDNTRDAYVNTALSLTNPPFNLSVDEKQYMSSDDASLQLGLITAFDITIDPIDVINSIDLYADDTAIYALTYGYYIEATTTLSQTLLGLNFNAIPMSVSFIIYENYLMYVHVTIEDVITTVQNTLIDNGSETLTLSIDYEQIIDYDTWEKDIDLPDDTYLMTFDLVDAFTLPDISSITDFLQ